MAAPRLRQALFLSLIELNSVSKAFFRSLAESFFTPFLSFVFITQETVFLYIMGGGPPQPPLFLLRFQNPRNSVLVYVQGSVSS